ncbi:PhoX family protein [Solirubrobacter phytolaccae]|uniref:PhoX family protein n=1 Tax=Solirubrobacter phytolaccae TaxID=1404360 RepID=A0A9X3SD14_9ACTN|nr:alkaline phosphatase PhoX [Solirubrobacter phytolaccae]MDA0183140.1 PhoX family protein [Solirubrobacter phytolaccae]
MALERTGYLDTATALANTAEPSDFSAFRALAASAADAFEVPEGYRAHVIAGYGDQFANEDGTLTYGFNNDYLAYFPLNGSQEGLLFINHEYPAPFFQHGVTNAANKTAAQVQLEQDSVGNSILHVKRDADGIWGVVSPSRYNRRITGNSPTLQFTGPLADNAAYPGIGETASGSLANCSGGITPWGTALSCEENYQDYPGLGWDQARTGTTDYVNGNGSTLTSPAKYGWVCEHDPYDPSFVGRKHTALGRFRHENTAFRAVADKPFVLYMGDDVNNGGVYKFVSDLRFRPGRREENLKILTSGKLYIAYWAPQSRRTFDAPGGNLTSPTGGTGYWREVTEAELVDTNARIAASVGSAEFQLHYATNRPEDVEVDEDGTVYIALTNNSTANDTHGSIRRLHEAGNDPTAVGQGAQFTWEDYAAGGPTGRPGTGEQGFSSPDNLTFDKAGNLWVVTDISSSVLNNPTNPNAYHRNNAVFMLPRSGPNAGVAFRFANMPLEAEATGPYFTPDEQTLFINVQHPGEETPNRGGVYGTVETYTSYWPKGNKTTGQNPSKPIPSLVAITKLPDVETDPDGDDTPPPSNVIPAPPTPPTPGNDGTPARLSFVSSGRQNLASLTGTGLDFKLRVDEPATLTVTLYGQLTTRKGRRGKPRQLARVTQRVNVSGEVTVRLRPSAALRVLLRRERAVPASLAVTATDAAGNKATRTKRLSFRRS